MERIKTGGDFWDEKELLCYISGMKTPMKNLVKPLSPAAQEALKKLQSLLQSQTGLIIAFSGGMDSGFLALAAFRTLKDRMRALFFDSELITESERTRAHSLAKQFGIPFQILRLDLLQNPNIASNPFDRCYWCKKAILQQAKILVPDGWNVGEGSQMDDRGDFRPGKKALKEEGIASPLLESGFTKDLIREVLRHWSAEAFISSPAPCLATRFPVNAALTTAGLRRVEAAESALRDAGFSQVRLRDHGEVARIEAVPAMFPQLLAAREALIAALKPLGYRYLTLDLEGYRQGSMNHEPSSTT